MNRRGFLSLLAGAVPALVVGPKLLDVQQVIWTPGTPAVEGPLVDLAAITRHLASQVRRIYGPMTSVPSHLLLGDGPLRHCFGVHLKWDAECPVVREEFDGFAELFANRLRACHARSTAPPPLPEGVFEAITVTVDGVSVRGLRDYDILTDRVLTRFDMVVG